MHQPVGFQLLQKDSYPNERLQLRRCDITRFSEMDFFLGLN